jgi:uncharacterized protein (DUF58 family)
VRPELERACAPYRLALPGRTVAGRSGERLGRGPGSSLEFLDFRDYVPGDDLRHVDWRAYARTDALKVRLFREEVSPHLDLVADASASMASTPAKERASRDLVEALAALCRRAGGHPRRLAAGAGPFEDAEGLRFAGGGDGGLLPLVPPRPHSLRALVSDFLTPRDPAPVLRRLAHGAAHLYVVQVLDPWEAAPSSEGALTLVDVEDGRRVELVLDAPTVAAYRTRVERLCAAVERAVRSLGGTYARVLAGPPADMLRGALLPAGLLEPA